MGSGYILVYMFDVLMQIYLKLILLNKLQNPKQVANLDEIDYRILLEEIEHR